MIRLALDPILLEKSNLEKSSDDSLHKGYDAVLNRKVWLKISEPSDDDITMVRKGLSRETRLRWLTGGLQDGAHWNAYEAPQGQSLNQYLEEKEMTWKNWNSSCLISLMN